MTKDSTSRVGRRSPTRSRAAALGLTLQLAGFILSSVSGHAQSVPVPRIGAPAGDAIGRVDYGWRIRPLDDEAITLGTFRGRVVFVNAWASWCVPCIREMASIEQLAGRLAGTGVAFLLVAVEREAGVRRHLRRYPIDLPVYLEEQRFPPVFGLHGIPMSWIVDREGRIVYRHYGAANWHAPEVEAFIRSLLPPAPAVSQQ